MVYTPSETGIYAIVAYIMGLAWGLAIGYQIGRLKNK
jgi:hypothetical protein